MANPRPPEHALSTRCRLSTEGRYDRKSAGGLQRLRLADACAHARKPLIEAAKANAEPLGRIARIEAGAQRSRRSLAEFRRGNSLDEARLQ